MYIIYTDGSEGRIDVKVRNGPDDGEETRAAYLKEMVKEKLSKGEKPIIVKKPSGVIGLW